MGASIGIHLTSCFSAILLRNRLLSGRDEQSAEPIPGGGEGIPRAEGLLEARRRQGVCGGGEEVDEDEHEDDRTDFAG